MGESRRGEENDWEEERLKEKEKYREGKDGNDHFLRVPYCCTWYSNYVIRAPLAPLAPLTPLQHHHQSRNEPQISNIPQFFFYSQVIWDM